MKNWILCLILLIGTPVWADEEKKPEPKKEEIKPEKKIEEQPSEENNPLPKILDLMREVEARLNDFDDAEENIQNNQKKMVEAMKFGNKARTALDDLIDKIEKQAEEENSKDQNKENSQSKNNKENPPKLNERDQAKMERDKKEAEKLIGSNPMPNKKNNPAEKTPNNKRDKGKPDSEDPNKLKNDSDKNTEPWGNLPSKLHEDAQKARSVKIPEKWRKQIEDYRQATAD